MKNKIVTTDIYLAAALLALGARLEDTDKTDTRHMKFTMIRDGYKFESENIPPVEEASLQPDLEAYEKQWVNGVLLINAVQFKDAIQRMKSVIHSSNK